MGGKFFERYGVRPGDGRQLKKIAVRLALASFTSIEFFLNLTLVDFFEIAEEIKEVNRYGE